MAAFESIPADIPDDNEALDDHDIFDNFSHSIKLYFVTPSGQQFSVQTERSEEDGGPFFRKIASGDVGYDMTRGAFEAEHALHEFVPENVPRPVSHGTYSTRFDLYHYLCEFVEMVDEAPSPVAWAKAAAALHKRSMRKPAKQFGFHCPNYSAHVPIAHEWKPSWETAWAFQMKLLLDQDNFLHGLDEEYSKLQASFFDVVVPTYLRPLESSGRSVTPCLIHSDLRPGNVKPRVDSDAVCMLNSSAYWGHHEAELGICRIPHYGLGERYLEEYLKHMPVSEPKEDFDVRNAIYAMKHHVLLSLIHREDPSFRQSAIDEMKQLVERAASS